jgi:hypothetical protein
VGVTKKRFNLPSSYRLYQVPCPHVCQYLAGRWVLRWCEEAEQAFALQNLFLTGLPLGAYFHVPDCGLSRIYKLKELQYAMVALQSTLAPIHSPLATLQHARKLRFLSTSGVAVLGIQPTATNRNAEYKCCKCDFS